MTRTSQESSYARPSSTTTLSLKGRQDAQALTEALAKQLSHLGAMIVVDLRYLTYISLEALLLLAALAERARRKDRGFQIRLPYNQKVCDFLAAWDFFGAVEEIYSTPYSDHFLESRLGSLARSLDPAQNPYMDAIRDRYGVLQRLYSNRFFSIQSFRRQPNLFTPSLATHVTGRWREDMVEAILRRMLPEGSELFRSRIVYEAMMNAIRHPGADLIQTSSAFNSLDHQTRLCVGFWDNGSAIPNTLRSALRCSREILGSGFGSVHCIYQVTERGTGALSQIVPTTPPSAEDTDAALLLASTFPGVTCDPAGITRPPDTPTPPGMGLYFLVNAALSVFGGTVVLRSGRFQVQLTASKTLPSGYDESFDALLGANPMGCWVPGNLVWVEIPTRSHEGSSVDVRKGSHAHSQIP